MFVGEEDVGESRCTGWIDCEMVSRSAADSARRCSSARRTCFRIRIWMES